MRYQRQHFIIVQDGWDISTRPVSDSLHSNLNRLTASFGMDFLKNVGGYEYVYTYPVEFTPKKKSRFRRLWS